MSMGREKQARNQGGSGKRRPTSVRAGGVGQVVEAVDELKVELRPHRRRCRAARLRDRRGCMFGMEDSGGWEVSLRLQPHEEIGRGQELQRMSQRSGQWTCGNGAARR